MKFNRYRRPRRLLLVSGLFIAVSCLAVFWHLKSSGRAERAGASNNPDKFYLWTTNSSFRYAFTYDPHAADVWLFQSGGGQMIGTGTAMLKLPDVSTNQRSGK